MKSILFIFLFSLIFSKNAFEVIECLAKDGTIFNKVSKVIESFKTKDLTQALPTALETFFSFKDIFTKCLKEDNEPKLQVITKGVYNPIALEKCKMMCGDVYYDEKCNQKCYEKFGGGILINNPIDIF